MVPPLPASDEGVFSAVQQLIRQIRFERSCLHALLRQLPVGVILVEAPSNRVVLCSDEAEKILGFSPLSMSREEDGLSRWNGCRQNGSIYKPVEWPMIRSIQTGELVEDEFILLMKPNGDPIEITMRSVPIRADDGQIVAAIAVFDHAPAPMRVPPFAQVL